MTIGGGFNAGTLAIPVEPEGYYVVYCAACQNTIGKLSAQQVTEAIIATLGRGGVLCPQCRSVTCDLCGTLGMVQKVQFPRKEELVSVCLDCAKALLDTEVSVDIDFENFIPF